MVGNCATCHGLWCAAALLEARANQTAERLAGVASKSVEANLHVANECKKSREKPFSDVDLFPARGAAGNLDSQVWSFVEMVHARFAGISNCALGLANWFSVSQ